MNMNKWTIVWLLSIIGIIYLAINAEYNNKLYCEQENVETGVKMTCKLPKQFRTKDMKTIDFIVNETFEK